MHFILLTIIFWSSLNSCLHIFFLTLLCPFIKNMQVYVGVACNAQYHFLRLNLEITFAVDYQKNSQTTYEICNAIPMLLQKLSNLLYCLSINFFVYDIYVKNFVPIERTRSSFHKKTLYLTFSSENLQIQQKVYLFSFSFKQE